MFFADLSQIKAFSAACLALTAASAAKSTQALQAAKKLDDWPVL